MVGTKPEDALRKTFTSLPAECYIPLTFWELNIGDRYIGLPLPGDNSGHGGFRGTHHVFKKTRKDFNPNRDNAVRLMDGVSVYDPAGMYVIRVD